MGLITDGFFNKKCTKIHAYKECICGAAVSPYRTSPSKEITPRPIEKKSRWYAAQWYNGERITLTKLFAQSFPKISNVAIIVLKTLIGVAAVLSFTFGLHYLGHYVCNSLFHYNAGFTKEGPLAWLAGVATIVAPVVAFYAIRITYIIGEEILLAGRRKAYKIFHSKR